MSSVSLREETAPGYLALGRGDATLYPIRGREEGGESLGKNTAERAAFARTIHLAP